MAYRSLTSEGTTILLYYVLEKVEKKPICSRQYTGHWIPGSTIPVLKENSASSRKKITKSTTTAAKSQHALGA